MDILRTLSIVLLLSSFMTACGGGGGNDGPELSTDACATLGLTTRIIQGTQCASPNSPVVRVAVQSQSGTVNLCSGTMLTSRHVLTAAHCFFGDVRRASIDVQGESIFGRVVYVHPEVRIEEGTNAVFNDIAILQLRSQVSLPTLPLIASRDVQTNDVISIFGYGLDEGGDAGVLRSGQMAVNSVTPNHVFARFDGAGSNTCSGDSGGPATITFNGPEGNSITGVVGVVSSGELITCESGDTTLFANTQSDSILNFITDRVPEVGVR